MRYPIQVITLIATYVHDPEGNTIWVKENVLLGIKEQTSNGRVYFIDKDNRRYHVNARHVLFR